MYGLGPLYTRCEDCGAAFPVALASVHECSEDRLRDLEFLRLREEIDRFEWEWRTFLASPHGRFEVWYAAQTRP